jgi:hypothetical protein
VVTAVFPAAPVWIGPPLTVREYDVLWHCHHGDGIAKPLVLDTPSPGTTWEDRHGLIRATWPELRWKGYVTQRRIEPGVVAVLNLLARPLAALDLRWFGRASRHALAVCHGDLGLLAVLDAGLLRVGRLDPSLLPEGLLGVLPAGQAPWSGSESMPLRGLQFAEARLRRRTDRLARQPYGEVVDALRAEGGDPRACELFARVAVTPAWERGELGAAAVVRGMRRRAEGAISVVDVPRMGRCLVVRRAAYVTLTGGAPARVAWVLRDALGSLTGR